MSDKTYTVQIMTHAEEVLRDIAFSIAYDLLAPEAAVSWALKTRDAIKGLSSFPSKVPLTPEEPWHSLGVRFIPVKNYIVFYTVNTDTVSIARIMYGARDLSRQLEETTEW